MEGSQDVVYVFPYRHVSYIFAITGDVEREQLPAGGQQLPQHHHLQLLQQAVPSRRQGAPQVDRKDLGGPTNVVEILSMMNKVRHDNENSGQRLRMNTNN